MSEIVSAGAGASKKNGSVQKKILKTAKKVRDSSHKTARASRFPVSFPFLRWSWTIESRSSDRPFFFFFLYPDADLVCIVTL